jgi:tripartite ATP-independent transporter DctP family solute receptor
MKIFRGFLKGLAVAGMLGTTPVLAQEVTMNFGFSTPEEHDYGRMAIKFKELVEDYSNGEIEVKIRCCSQISTEDDAFKALQLGTVDAFFITQNNISPHWPLMDVFVLPYVFENREHIDAVLSGPVGQTVREQIYADTGVHLLTFGGVFFRDMYSVEKPVTSFADFEGLKFRVPKNEVMIDTIGSFGAEPIPLAWSETPTALQTGTIDASDNGIGTIKSMKFYEFAKHLVILEHFSGTSPLLASDRFISRLTDDQRAAVQRAADEAGQFMYDFMRDDLDSLRTWLVEQGGMTRHDPDRAPFIAAAQKIQDEVASGASDQFRALLTEIRAAAPDK